MSALTEMPTTNEMRNKRKAVLYECPEFRIDGVMFGNKLHLHADWPNKHLTLSLYKKALLAIKGIRNECKEHNIPALYCLVPESLLKWEQMLGFAAIEKWSNKLNPDEPLYLMKQEA